MRSLTKQRGRSREGLRVRFFGYGPRRFFAIDMAGGRDVFLDFPIMFEDDTNFGLFFSLGVAGSPCICTESALFHNFPTADDRIVEIDDVWDGINWDRDVRQE